MSGPSDDSNTSNSRNLASDYPEPYETAFERYLAYNNAIWDARNCERKLQPDYPHDKVTSKSLYQKRFENLHADTFLSGLQRHDPPGESGMRTPPLENAPVDPASPTSACTQTAPTSPTTPANFSTSRATTPSNGNTKIKIELQEGFEWNRESLALLCKWKEALKKGSRVAVKSGAFPGHTTESISLVWKDRRVEARHAYEEVYSDGLAEGG